jgi:hypothetical protein
MDLAHCGLLDEKHHRLLRTLGQQQRWSRDEYERVVAEAGLLPDGALEVLNDLAFAVCDAPLLDGDDPIDLDLAVYQEVLK